MKTMTPLITLRRQRTKRFGVSTSATLVALVVIVGVSASPLNAASAYRLVKVASAKSPVGVVWHPTTALPYVIEQGGRLRPIVTTKVGAPALDVSKDVSTGGEQGLLGAAFSPDGSLLFVNLTNPEGDTEIREYSWSAGKADATTKRIVLDIDQPYSNHNGGHLIVDSAGLLWIGMGDGGSSGDPEGRAQNLDSLLGKMLRIDPRPDVANKKGYSIPPDNPFVSGGGRPEIWASGLRNPWRFDIDPGSKKLLIGDVGQNEYEEVSVVGLSQAGANFGWNLREGTRAYNKGIAPEGAIEPIYEYPHSDGCSVTGGVVYRGQRLRGLAGSYVFGDYCKGWIGLLTERNGKWVHRKLGVKIDNLSSLNRAPDGEVWVTSTGGAVAKIDRR
jgi:glucose/arabinose dehydrogenase